MVANDECKCIGKYACILANGLRVDVPVVCYICGIVP